MAHFYSPELDMYKIQVIFYQALDRIFFKSFVYIRFILKMLIV